MILQSDNTATNVLIDRVGMAAVNQRMAALGLTGTRLRRHMIDLDAARRGDENVATPADLARLVLAFHRGEGLSASSKARRARRFCRSPSGRRSEPACLPKSPSPARAASWKACVPTPASSTSRAGRMCLSRWGRSCERTRSPQARSSSSRALSYGYFSRRATVSAYGRQIK